MIAQELERLRQSIEAGGVLKLDDMRQLLDLLASMAREIDRLGHELVCPGSTE